MAADPLDLTTLDSVKKYLGVVASSDDAMLQAWITGVSRWMADYCTQPLVSTPQVETRDGGGGTVLFLRFQPASSVTLVKVNGATIPAAAPGGTDDGWLLDDLGCIRLRGDYAFTRGTQNVQISYSCGWSPVPQSLERAAVSMVAWRYKEKDRIGQASKGIGGETVSFSVEEAPKDVLVLLKQYRRVVPA